MKRHKDRTLKDELPRLVGAQYATGEEWRNNSRRNEEAESKWTQCPVVDVSGGESQVWSCKEQYCIGTWNVRSMNQGCKELVTTEWLTFSHSASETWKKVVSPKSFKMVTVDKNKYVNIFTFILHSHLSPEYIFIHSDASWAFFAYGEILNLSEMNIPLCVSLFHSHSPWEFSFIAPLPIPHF